MRAVSTKITYEQEVDCCSDADLGQWVTVETHDGGGGVYLTITTQRWAIEDVDDFADQLRRVLAMVSGEGDGK